MADLKKKQDGNKNGRTNPGFGPFETWTYTNSISEETTAPKPTNEPAEGGRVSLNIFPFSPVH